MNNKFTIQYHKQLIRVLDVLLMRTSAFSTQQGWENLNMEITRLNTIYSKTDAGKISEIEFYAGYFYYNRNRIIDKKELKTLNVVHQCIFNRFFDEHFEEVKKELQDSYGLKLIKCPINLDHPRSITYKVEELK